MLETMAVFGAKAILSQAPDVMDKLFGNDSQNRLKAAQRSHARLQHKNKVDNLLHSFRNSWNKTDSYNRALVAGHNAKVDQYNTNIALLQKEEAYAYEAAQLNANAEVASFFADNLDLLQSYVQGSGQLAAAGITSGSAQLAEMKNNLGGMLQAKGRRQGAAAGAISGILREVEKMNMQGNAQREAMYARVKNKPILRNYPSMPPIPVYRTPPQLKATRLGISDFAGNIAKGALAGFDEIGGFDIFKGGGDAAGAAAAATEGTTNFASKAFQGFEGMDVASLYGGGKGLGLDFNMSDFNVSPLKMGSGSLFSFNQ